jgi:hypothetical protein
MMRRGHGRAASLATVAVALVAAMGTQSALTQASTGEALDRRVARLSAQVGVLTSRLERTRAAVRRQRSRVASLERRVEQGGSSGAGLRSRDRRFSVDVSNEGLRLRGPSASVVVGATAVTLTTGAGTSLQLAPARTTLRAPQLIFGAGTNCPPLARLGDAVQIQTTGELARGTIVGASTGVFAC